MTWCGSAGRGLLVSAWARRVPWLWATLPLLSIGLLERIAFGRSRLADLLLDRVGGGAGGSELMSAAGGTASLGQLAAGSLLRSAGLWVGLAVAAAFLAAATYKRRRRGPC